MRMETKKAALVDRTESGKGQVTFEGVRVPESDFIIDYQPRQGTIAALLLRGRDNAQTTAELARIIGLHPRKVTRAIQRERLRGAPILSDGAGFWIAESAAEVRRCAAALHSRAREIHRTARALEKITERGL